MVVVTKCALSFFLRLSRFCIYLNICTAQYMMAPFCVSSNSCVSRAYCAGDLESDSMLHFRILIFEDVASDSKYPREV